MPEQQEQVDLIIYRVRESGLEVFLMKDDTAQGQLKAPSTNETGQVRLADGRCIALDPVRNAQGAERKAIAVEADWHELPSLRALIYEDFRVAKEKARERIRHLVPDLESGAFVAVKEAVKKVMPEQYAFLKELKDIMTDKNQTKYI